MKVKKSDILISYPYLDDPFFDRSVICMMESNEEGSFGLIINKKMPYRVCDHIPQFPQVTSNLYMGGPVETDSFFFLHPYKDLKGSIKVSEDLYWNGDINELRDMFELEFAHPHEMKFFLGYSGWGEGQLEEEMTEKSWLIAPHNLELIFDQTEDDLIWRKAVESLGDEFKSIAHYPINPNMN